MKRIAIFGLVAVLALAAQSASATTNLIQNGSFENGVNPGSGFVTVFSGDSVSIDNWTVIDGFGAFPNGSVDYIGGYWAASDGARSIDLSGNSPGGVAQTFATVIGKTYFVQFDMAANPDGLPDLKLLISTAGNSPVIGNVAVGGFTASRVGQTHANMGWDTKTFVFTAQSTSTILAFQAAQAGPYGPALDNVRVSAVPEPVTMFSAFMAISSLGMYIRKRSRA